MPVSFICLSYYMLKQHNKRNLWLSLYESKNHENTKERSNRPSMPEIIQNIYDYDGRIIHPITSVNAIVTEDGQNLDSYIDDKIT